MKEADKLSDVNSVESPLIEHIRELRTRLIHAILGVLGVFLALLGFSNSIYHIAAEPLLRALPAGGKLIATNVVAPFLIPLQLTLWIAFFVSIPWVLYQFWAFVAPGLYKKEKKIIFPLIFSTTLLFYIGMVFAYFLVLPAVSHFMVNTLPNGVEMATDIGNYLSFFLKIIFLFGVAFEIPVAVMILVATNVISQKTIIKKWRHIVLITAIISALVTPPDIFSMLLFGSLSLALFALGLLGAKFLKISTEAKKEE